MGARGLKFEFQSVQEAGLYLLSLYPNPDRKLEIDRIDTNRGYAVGNLRMVDRATNQANRRKTVLSKYREQDWPYSYNVVQRMLRRGLSRAQIMESARMAVQQKRKNWRTIQKRLESMTLEMPAGITVTPYLES